MNIWDILQDIWYVVKTSGLVLLQTLGIIIVYSLWKWKDEEDKKKRKRRLSEKQRRENYFSAALINFLYAGLCYACYTAGDEDSLKRYFVVYVCTIVPGFYAIYENHKNDKGFPSNWTDKQIEEAERR